MALHTFVRRKARPVLHSAFPCSSIGTCAVSNSMLIVPGTSLVNCHVEASKSNILMGFDGILYITQSGPYRDGGSRTASQERMSVS
jgi:hypothetical protein